MSADRPPRVLIGLTVDMSLVMYEGYLEMLADRGWDVHVVTSPGPRLEELGQYPGITAHPLPMERDPSPVSDLRSLQRWVKLIRKIKPDVTSLGTPKAGLLGIAAARIARVPQRQYIIHGLRLETTEGRLRAMLTAFEKFAIASSTDTVAVSPSLRQRVIDLGLAGKRTVTVVGDGSASGIDLDRFRPAKNAKERAQERAKLGITSGAPVIGFVGRLNVDKGVDTLMEASRLMSSNGVEHQLLIVGGVDDTFSQGVVDEMKHLDAPVFFTGAVKDTAPYYRAMDVFALPTLREGLGTVSLEAAASALPVVTTTATGAINSIVDRVTGILVPTRDQHALADALTAVVSDATKQKAFGQAGLKWVQEHYERSHVQNLYADHLAVLAAAAQQKRKP